MDQADEMNVSTGAHKSKVVAYEIARGGDQALTEDTAAEEPEVELPSKRRKQEGDPDLRTPLGFSLCDGSSDDDNELVERRRSEQLYDVLSEVRDVKSELLHVREFLGVLVRRGRCAETKSKIAARRLDRTEQEKDEVADAEHKAHLQEALTNKTKISIWSSTSGSSTSASALATTRATMLVPRGGCIEHKELGDRTRGDKKGTRRRRTESRNK